MSAGLFHVYYKSVNYLGIPVKNGFYFAALNAEDALQKFSSYAVESLGGMPDTHVHVELAVEAGSVTFQNGKVTLSSD